LEIPIILNSIKTKFTLAVIIKYKDLIPISYIYLCMVNLQKISEKCNELRQKSNKESTSRVVFGVNDFDAILSYHPKQESITISVIPDDFKRSSAEKIIDIISKEFGRNYGEIKESDSGAVIEFTTKINWSHD